MKNRESLDFITGIKIKHYLYLFEEFVAIKNQIKETIREDHLVKLNRSLESKRAELSKAFGAITKHMNEDQALEIVKSGAEEFGGYDQLDDQVE